MGFMIIVNAGCFSVGLVLVKHKCMLWSPIALISYLMAYPSAYFHPHHQFLRRMLRRPILLNLPLPFDHLKINFVKF